MPLMDGLPVGTSADVIDAALPQTQCGRCGHDGCRPYAEAIAVGEPINRCPPGGDALIAVLASLTDRPIVPLDPARGRADLLHRAIVDEAQCIGCTLCIQACPVDAIVGGPKRMHTIIAAACTGCELCIPPCPVDCIAMIPAGRSWSPHDAAAARERYTARNARADRARGRAATADDATPTTAADAAAPLLSREQRQAAAAAALERARARRQVRA